MFEGDYETGVRRDLSLAFRWGYLFESVSRVLNEYLRTKSLRDADIVVLRNALDFLESVVKGQEDISSARVRRDAVEAIGAYRRSLAAFAIVSAASKVNGELFAQYIKSLESAIREMSESKKVADERFVSVKKFFDSLNQKNYREVEVALEAFHVGKTL